MPREDAHTRVPQLVRELADGQRLATPVEATEIRAFYDQRGLPRRITDGLRDKHHLHVDERAEWPEDTSPDDYLASLRATVVDERTAIYVTFEPDLGDWVVYFVGQIRRQWRGPRAGQRLVVLFRSEPPRWITGFQARDRDVYVESQGGRWIYRPR